MVKLQARMSFTAEMVLGALLFTAPAVPFLVSSVSTSGLTLTRVGAKLRIVGLDVDACSVAYFVAVLIWGVFLFIDMWGSALLLFLVPASAWRYVVVASDATLDVRLFFLIPWSVRRIPGLGIFTDSGWGDEADPTNLTLKFANGRNIALATALTKADADRLQVMQDEGNAFIDGLRRTI